MKRLTLVVMLALFGTAVADADTRTDTRALWSNTIVSAGMCSAGIAFSNNPSKAASIGIPVAAVGNLLAWKVAKRHPKVATLLQIGSGGACLGTGLSLSSKPQTVLSPHVVSPLSPSVPTTGTGTGASGGSGSSTGGSKGNGGSGSTASSGTGSGTGSSGGSGDGGPEAGNSGTGGTGGTGSGVTGTGGNGSGSGSVPRCLQDCGLGNHGVNSGNDTKKPPFLGVGPRH
jgi:hypothetical protein